MSSYNKVILMGNLVRDPEVRFTQNNVAVVGFTLAVNRRYKVGDEWKDEPSFIDCTLWGKRGEAFAKFHQGGSAAFIEGYLKMDQWEDSKTGQKRSKLKVVADQWEFVQGSGKPKEAPPSSTDNKQPEETGKADFLGAMDTPF